MEQGQDLGRAAPDVFVRLGRRSPSRLPRHTGMRHGLKGTGLVLTPDREPKLRPQRVGLLDQLFFATASGSLTRTTPCLRWRITTPVSHQVRLFCQLRPPRARCALGRIEARTGLRMMPTFPRSPRSFRTAGFPQYGWKAGLSGGAFPDVRGLSLLPAYAC